MENNKNEDCLNKENKKLNVVEESLIVNKVREAVGEVTVEKTVEEVEESLDVKLSNEEVIIDRIKIGKEIANYPLQREEDGKIIIPVVKEKIVVVKQLILEEEIHISKKTNEEIKNIKETVRKDKINIIRK